MEVFDIREKPEYIKEVAILEHNEWGHKTNTKQELEDKINKKIKKIKNSFNDKYFCKLILLDEYKLVGFISIFPLDGDERKDLSPWYATMYVKKEYRGKGYSKILNNAILNEAKSRGTKRIYLKTDLVNYYEKFGAKPMGNLSNEEKLYYFDI